jgi:transcriptional regulator with GAF, ATPase, and Fis domain
MVTATPSRLWDSVRYQTPLGRLVHEQSLERWGEKQAVVVIGTHPSLHGALEKLCRFAQADGPVLITGETGTGKELFARALYLLSKRSGAPYIGVNCAQYQEGQLMASELFGHRRGSFTGAIGDHRGVFEAADGGTVFLDEVGELSLQAQAMLLRILSEGEIVPVGETRSRRVDVRVIAATNRDLRTLVASGRFRTDLYYRLRYLHLTVPPVRERGCDWELILEDYLSRLWATHTVHKRFSPEARTRLAAYSWPGNVREVRALVELGFHASAGETIEIVDFVEALEMLSREEQLTRLIESTDEVEGLYDRLSSGRAQFWDAVYRPYMERNLCRKVVRRLVARGLSETRGSYRALLKVFGVADADYLKFMDFLRHQHLKPE